MQAIPTELPEGPLPAHPCRNLWSSVILQALADTQIPSERDSARYWLRSDRCREICEMLGIEHELLMRRVG